MITLTLMLGACGSLVFHGSMMMLIMLFRGIQFVLIIWSHVGVSTLVGGVGDYVRGRRHENLCNLQRGHGGCVRDRDANPRQQVDTKGYPTASGGEGVELYLGGTSTIQEELGRDADLSEGVECYSIGCGGVIQRASTRCRAGHVG